MKTAGGAYEAPGILKVDSTYYLIVSGKTGWRSNPNKGETKPRATIIKPFF